MQNAIQYIRTELATYYDAAELNFFIRLIIRKITGFSATDVIVNKNTVFSSEQNKEIKDFVEKLKKFIPVQYIIGETEFFGLTFNVNESVLIPRPETEELVEWIGEENNRTNFCRILDIGTGSGCIAVSLKKLFPNAEVDAFDISDGALDMAAENARKNQLEVQFSKVDILNPPRMDKKWDIIVSNPPYVLEREKENIQPVVLENEPHMALFVPDNDPLLFYRKIAGFARTHLSANGKLYFEINREYGQATCDLLRENGFADVELRKDMSGNDRMVRAVTTSP